jgi:hypothetical protein
MHHFSFVNPSVVPLFRKHRDLGQINAELMGSNLAKNKSVCRHLIFANCPPDCPSRSEDGELVP